MASVENGSSASDDGQTDQHRVPYPGTGTPGNQSARKISSRQTSRFRDYVHVECRVLLCDIWHVSSVKCSTGTVVS